MSKTNETQQEIDDMIANFHNFEKHMEADYVLFLFQSYNFS